jgi:hypothetical protein
MSKYTTQRDRKVEVGVISIGCCDCGLVHKMGFVMATDGSIRIDFERDERATAQMRRGRRPYLKKGSGKWKMVRLKS